MPQNYTVGVSTAIEQLGASRSDIVMRLEITDGMINSPKAVLDMTRRAKEELTIRRII